MTDESSAAAPGSAPGPRPGLRERQKAQTRADIRAAALALFAEHGYEATTVAQIADAANVSHTTFFRYFQSKEQVIITDDLEDQRAGLLRDLEPGLSAFDAVRAVITRFHAIAERDPWAADPDRLRILRTEPALRATFQFESDRIMTETTGQLAAYLRIDTDDERLRIFIAAISGVFFHLSALQDDAMAPIEFFLDALDFMERGFPLD